MAFDEIYGAPPPTQSLQTPTRATDVVAITGANFVQLFSTARPLTAAVTELAEVMEHPLETGSVIADHIVFKPLEIELPLVCVGEDNYRSVYADIRTAFNAGTLLTVRTRTGSYANMVITDLPHDETPDAFDAVTLRLRLRMARFVTPRLGLSPRQVRDPKQASTSDRGSQQTSAVGGSKSAQVNGTAANSGQGATPKGSTLYQWAYPS